MPQYPTSHIGRALSGSIGTQPEIGSDDGHREEDAAHYNETDPENNAAVTPRSRTRHDSVSSPLKKTESAFKSMSHNIRRASLRVVNLASAGLDEQMWLGEGESGEEDQQLPDLERVPIRGRTLGFLGPESKLRRALFHFLVHP